MIHTPLMETPNFQPLKIALKMNITMKVAMGPVFYVDWKEDRYAVTMDLKLS